MFYFKDCLTVKRGDEIFGVFTCNPNDRNNVSHFFNLYSDALLLVDQDEM